MRGVGVGSGGVKRRLMTFRKTLEDFLLMEGPAINIWEDWKKKLHREIIRLREWRVLGVYHQLKGEAGS